MPDYPNIREALDPRYQHLADRRIEVLIPQVSGMSAEEMENFLRFVKGAGAGIAKAAAPLAKNAFKGLKQAAPTIQALSPLISLIPGAAPLAPLLAGGLSLLGTSKPTAGRRAQPAAGATQPVVGAPATAAAQQQLAALLPSLLAALGPLLLGKAGKKTVAVEQVDVPIESLVELFEVALSQSRADHIREVGSEPGVLVFEERMNESLEARGGDFTNPEHRAAYTLSVIANEGRRQLRRRAA